jgi:hypothetical protein
MLRRFSVEPISTAINADRHLALIEQEAPWQGRHEAYRRKLAIELVYEQSA